MVVKLKATVIERTINTPDVVTLNFTVDGGPMTYTAGQYITVFFDDTNVKVGKAYSLSSSPHDSFSSITVKKIGLFSGKLHDLQVGDTFDVSTPYGFFNAKNDKPVIAIAAGVGIAPIWSILRYEYGKAGIHPQTTLLYSNKTRDGITFHIDINTLSDHEDTFDVKYFVTQQPGGDYQTRRISIAEDIADIETDRCYYICGSADFVGSIWRQLARAGVSETSISTETFFETV